MSLRVSFAVLVVFASPVLRAADDCSAALEVIRDKNKIPALAAAAIKDGEIVSIGATGLRRLRGTERVTVEDKWHLGSCTKSMTASVAAMLVEEDRIRWTSTMGEWLGQGGRPMDKGWKDVTLEQLLSHRGGAPHDVPPRLWLQARMMQGTNEEQRDAFVAGLIVDRPVYPPGTKFDYSNQGYTMVSAMMWKATAKPWEDVMREKLFGPLGLKSAGFGAAGSPDKEDQPWGHIGQSAVAPGPAADNPPAIWPGGGVHMSIGDFARYAGWHAASAKLLKPETFQKLHTPFAGDYGFGWHMTERGWGGKVITHNGTNTMNYAVMWISPEKNFAVVAACNMGGDSAEKACDAACATLIGKVLEK